MAIATIKKKMKMISKFDINPEETTTGTSRNFKTNHSSLQTSFKVSEATTTEDSEWH